MDRRKKINELKDFTGKCLVDYPILCKEIMEAIDWVADGYPINSHERLPLAEKQLPQWLQFYAMHAG